MKPKHLLILSIVAGLLAVLLVRMQIHRERGDAVVVFRATEDAMPGQALGSRVEAVTLPGDNYFPNLLKEAPTAEMEELVVNTPLLQPIQRGEIVLFQHLEQTVDRGIRSRIPAGMKAVSIEVDETTSVGFLIEPGDRVDVLAALPRRSSWPGPDTEELDSNGLLGALTGPGGGASAMPLATRPLLMGVEVLAVGARYRREDVPVRSRRQGYSTVTLLVTLEEAQELAFARDVLVSPMTLVLRSPLDDRSPEGDQAVRAEAHTPQAADR